MSPLQTAWYWSVRNLVKWVVFKGTGGFKVSGTEHVPLKGPLIVAPNHSSYLDPPVTACAMPRVVTFMAKEELFRSKGFAALIRSLGAFPVKRGAGDIESIRIALSILEADGALLIFPEGTRNYGDVMLSVNRGVEMLAKKSGALVLPVGITGTASKWGKGKKPRWGGVRVRFGEPMRFEDYIDSRDAFGKELRRRILELCHADGNPIKSEADSSLPSSSDCLNGQVGEPARPESDETPVQP